MRQQGGRWEKTVEGWSPYDRKKERGRPLIRWRDEFRGTWSYVEEEHLG